MLFSCSFTPCRLGAEFILLRPVFLPALLSSLMFRFPSNVALQNLWDLLWKLTSLSRPSPSSVETKFTLSMIPTHFLAPITLQRQCCGGTERQEIRLSQKELSSARNTFCHFIFPFGDSLFLGRSLFLLFLSLTLPHGVSAPWDPSVLHT